MADQREEVAAHQESQSTKQGDSHGSTQNLQMNQNKQRGQTGMAQRSMGMPSLFAMSPYELMQMNPFRLMRRFSEDMDRMFEALGTGRMPHSPQTPGSELQQQSGFGQSFFAPQIEVFERNGQFIVCADLPGLSKDDVRVELTDEGLLLEGERRFEHHENQGGIYRSERSYGTFRRLIPLPEGVNTENAQATFKNGVLEITMQAPQIQSRGRRIEIQSGGNTAQQQKQESQTTQIEQTQTANPS